MARSQQHQIPEMKDAKNEKLSKLALKYAEVRDERMRVQRKEAEAKVLLLNEMKELKIDRYEDLDDDVLVVLTEKENVKVSKPSEDHDDED